jgi:hypothetical protein
MQMEKAEVGRRIVFLGILIDTERMMVSFDAVQAKGMREMLGHCLHQLRTGSDLEAGLARHIAGCLNWYSEVLQSGRMRLRGWWMYVQHGQKLNRSLRQEMMRDTEWWLEVLLRWEMGEPSGREYPILSASQLQSDRGLVWVLQSDASGPDGFGYHYGRLEADSYTWISHRWCDGYEFGSSHDGKLMPLLHFLRARLTEACLLVWVSDSLSAVWSVNKGRCHTPKGLAVLGEILSMCDEYRVQLVPLWVPREENFEADDLSHLSTALNRKEVRGTRKLSQGATGKGGGGGSQQGQC